MPRQDVDRTGLLALTRSRLLGAWAVFMVAQLAVDMPEGYFGPADQVTLYGASAAALYSLGSLYALWHLYQGRHDGRLLVPVLLSLQVGIFLPAMTADPVIAGAAVLWSLVLMGQHFFALPSPSHGSRSSNDDPLELWMRRRSPSVMHLALVGLVLSVAVAGYRLSSSWLAFGVCVFLGWWTLGASAAFLRLLLRRQSRGAWLTLLAAAVSLLWFLRPAGMLWSLVLAQGGILLLLLWYRRSTEEVLASFYRHPSRLILATFLLVILLGTLLLTFPAASASSDPIRPLDALFTATSATCVTGLIVLDTPNDLSTLGQIVVLLLIQVGGLGIMVLSTFAALLLGGTLGLRGEGALTELLETGQRRSAFQLTRFIVLSTLAIEAVGAMVLGWRFAVRGMSWGEAAWHGVFHAVSAFCNAGFALHSDSVISLQRDPVALITLMLLITLGGLGFAVLAALRWSVSRKRRVKVNTQVRIVLAASGALFLFGSVLYAALEWHRSLDGLAPPLRVLNALFQSVTLRTAGFNSVPFGDLDSLALAPATVLMMLVLMAIGASPGSTGGGIKTTTFAVLLATIVAQARGSQRVVLFRREVAAETVYRSLSIALLYILITCAGLFLLVLLEPLPFLPLVFEAISATGTVGLSLGVTGSLGVAGKLVIIGMMFIGRVGPLTLALFLGTSGKRNELYRYPVERVMVG